MPWQSLAETLLARDYSTVFPFCCIMIIMKTTLSVNQRGVVTLPAKLRKALGIKGEDLLLAETTPEGVLLRPAVALPVEAYSQERLGEFKAAEEELESWYENNG